MKDLILYRYKNIVKYLAWINGHILRIVNQKEETCFNVCLGNFKGSRAF